MKKISFFIVILFLQVTALCQFSPVNPDFIRYLDDVSKGKAGNQGDYNGVIPPVKSYYTSPEQYPAPKKMTTTLPAVYDLRAMGLMTSVKNQGSCNSGWTFGTYGSIESTWKAIGLPAYDLSENNMKDCHGFDMGPCSGGNSWMAISYLTSLLGPQFESQDPYVAAPAACMNQLGPPHPEYIFDARFLPKDIPTIKQAVMEYGAIYTVFYYDPAYYNNAGFTYYYNGTHVQNQGVTIAGWDDTKVTAGGTGAWIIKNNYGTSFGDNGYFYISYNDSQVNDEVCYYPTHHSPNSACMFKGDRYGEVLDYGFGSPVAYAVMKMHNACAIPILRVFTWIASGNGSVDIEVWSNFNGVNFSGLLASMPGIQTPYMGYYSLDLPAPIPMLAYDFYVKVRYYTPGYNYPIPVESVLPGYSSNAVINCAGWVSPDGTNWTSTGGPALPFDLCISSYSAYEPVAPVITAAAAQACTETPIIIPLTVTGFSNITSMTARLDYDASLISWTSFANTNPSLTGLNVTDELLTGTMHKLMIKWRGASATTITGGEKVVDLNFIYHNGNPVLTFNNYDDYGWDCQFTDTDRSPLFDNPTATYYQNSQITSLGTLIQPTISGQNLVCAGSGMQEYTTEPGMTNYVWNVSTGGTIISGNGTNLVEVGWNVPGTQWVSVNYNSLGACTPPNPTSFPVSVGTPPPAAGPITGAEIVCQGDSGLIYTVAPVNTAMAYIWSFPAGVDIIDGLNTTAIRVKYSGTAQSGIITVTPNNLCGNGAVSQDLPVTVNPAPPAPVIAQQGDSLFSDAPAGNQWYGSGGLIAGETGDVYLPPANGDYYDVVTLNGCSSEHSNTVSFVLTGINPVSHSLGRIYPNPAMSSIHLETFLTRSSEITITLMNITGTIEKTISLGYHCRGLVKSVIDCDEVREGIYFLKVCTNYDSFVGKVILKK